MAFDPVPWAISGAATDAASARVLAYMAVRGAQGIVLPGDFKVTALGTPGAAVNISTGGMAVNNQQAAGENYVGLARSTTQVPVAGTTGSPRSDLIIGQIIDPAFAPWQPYTDPNMVLNGPYFQPFVLSGVASNTTSAQQVVSYSAYALARIDIPASTSAITNAMITDLRSLAQPRSSREIFMSNPTAEVQLTNPAGIVWPDFRPTVTVPTWATQAYMITTITSVGQRVDAAQGLLTAVMNGTLLGATGLRANDITYDLDSPSGGHARHTLVVGGGFTDVTSIAGQTVPLQTEGRPTNQGIYPGYLVTVAGTQVIFDVQFYERTR